MIIIGFGHKKRVGKDTAVRFAMNFAKQYYPTVTTGIISFGNELKDIAHRMFSWAGLETTVYYENHPQEIEEILPACGKSPRMIWDEVGLLGRKIHPRVWVEMGATHAPEAQVLFCKDVRFQTEIDLIDKFQGFKYRIDRNASLGGAVDQALDSYTGWTGVIRNNGSLKDLNIQIKGLVAMHLNKLVPPEKFVCYNCFAKANAFIDVDAVWKCAHCKAPL